MSANVVSGLVSDPLATSAIAALMPASEARETRTATRDVSAVTPGEAFTARVQQTLDTLNLTPTSHTSTAELSTVLYDLFQAIDSEGAPAVTVAASPAGSDSPAAAPAPSANVVSASPNSSPWKPVDMVSGLHTLIAELQAAHASVTSTGTTQVTGETTATAQGTVTTTSGMTSASASLRPQLAQLQADFATLVNGTAESPSHMTATLIQFLKALQQNLPAWPPSSAAVGGSINSMA